MFSKKRAARSAVPMMYVLNAPYKTWCMVSNILSGAQVRVKDPVYVVKVEFIPEEGWYAQVWQEGDGDQFKYIPLAYLVSSDNMTFWEYTG